MNYKHIAVPGIRPITIKWEDPSHPCPYHSISCVCDELNGPHPLMYSSLRPIAGSRLLLIMTRNLRSWRPLNRFQPFIEGGFDCRRFEGKEGAEQHVGPVHDRAIPLTQAE